MRRTPPPVRSGARNAVSTREEESPHPRVPCPRLRGGWNDLQGWGERCAQQPSVVQTAGPTGDGEVEQNRSLSPIARFAAADPQVTRVLQDIVQFLRGLEKRLGALEGRLGSAPALDEGVLVAAPAPASGEKKRKRRRKGKMSTADGLLSPKPPHAATPVKAVSSARAPVRPLGPMTSATKANTSKKKGAITPKCMAPTPGAVKQILAKTATATDEAGVNSRKKKAEKGG